MKRHNNIIHTTKIHKQCISQLEWATYHNVAKMYSLIYAEMVISGIAKQLQSDVYFNKYNHIVPEGDSSIVGTFSNIQVTEPSYLILVDETGLSTNMKMDKKGTKRIIAEKGYAGTKKAITTNIRYTTMGFTAATGEPVMCCIIMQSEITKGIPVNWITGNDITKIDATFQINEDNEEMIKNVRECSVVSGGPTCIFRNTNVPCFV
jgi:hypothetical protein